MLYFLPHIRRDRQLSLGDLARLVAKDRQALSRLERGERPRDIALVERLAAALNVSSEALTANAITIHRDGRIEVTR